LIVSAADGHAEMVRLLLDSGADITAVDSGMQATALHAAAYLRHPEAMRVLVEYGIDMDAQGPYNGYTALHDAVWQNNVEGVRVLVNAGARTDIKGKNGETPLDIAKKNGRKEIIAILSGA
jgi:ankyrin repeat protein